MTTTDNRPTAVGEIRNPVLPGFHPDPSLIRVGDRFVVATSTFQWFPGVALHTSTDLATWEPLPHPLTRTAQLDLVGVPDSGGVWAPGLSLADGELHLVYTVVTGYNLDGFYDCPNYHVSAPSPEGPWSDPVPLHARGFDPSLYHEDGRSWLLSMEWDHRPGRPNFAGILIQEFDRATRTLLGPAHRLFAGTALGITEGPHLYRHDGWYYLVVAEGGTSYGHAITVARSTTLLGPYEPDPAGPMLTSAGRPDLELQKAGHGSLVETAGGEWYVAHLVARPIDTEGHCVLGRETAIQPVRWVDGWPRVDGGVPAVIIPPPHPGPAVSTPPPTRGQTPMGRSCGSGPTETGGATGGPAAPSPDEVNHVLFGPELEPHWQSVRRVPEPSWLSLAERPGALRLRADESPASRHRVSLVARRQQSTHLAFEAVVEAAPAHYQQMAGLIHYYDSTLWHWLMITHDELVGRCLTVLTCDRGRLSDPMPHGPIAWPHTGEVRMRVRVDAAEVRFSAAVPGGQWRRVGPVLDATALSDEHAGRPAVPGGTAVEGFTGAFVGVCAADLTGARLVCDVLSTATTTPQ